MNTTKIGAEMKTEPDASSSQIVISDEKTKVALQKNPWTL